MEEGSLCPKCKRGLLVLEHNSDADGCSCHMGNPPCSYCTDTYLECPECYEVFE